MRKLAIYALMAILLSIVVFANPTVNNIGAQTVTEGQTLTMNLGCTAPDNGTTTFSFSSNPTMNFGNIVTNNNTAGTLTFTPTLGDAGSYTITATTADSDSQNSKSFTLTVNAATTSIEVSTITLGGNKDKEDGGQRNNDYSKTFTVKNTGNIALNNIALSFVSQDIPQTSKESEYNIRFSTNTISTLAAGASTTVTVTGFIPLDFDAVDDNLEASSFQIGTVRATSGNVQGNGVLRMQAVNQLGIDKAYFFLNGEENGEKLSDNDKVENVKPGDSVKLEVTVKNTFDENDEEDDNGNDMFVGDIDIEDINVEFEIDDDELDIEEDDELDDLGGEDKDVIEIEFDVEEDASDSDYSGELRVYGEDENGAKHGEMYDIKLEVVRETHEISVKRASFTQETITCEGTTDLKVYVQNTGKRNERDAAVSVANSDLKIDMKKDELDMDKDDAKTLTFPIKIEKGTEAGTYTFLVKGYYSGTIFSTEESAKLTIVECEEEKEAPKQTEEKEAPEEKTEQKQVITPTKVQPVRTVQQESDYSTVYTTVIVVAIVLVIGGIIGLLAKLLIRK